MWLPRYDKSANSGEGDRNKTGSLIDARDLDVLLLEGWMLGFRAVKSEALSGMGLSLEDEADMQFANKSLKAYEAIYSYIDQWLVLKVNSTSWVYSWRRDQEEDTHREKGSGLNPHEVNGFVDRLMPFYALYLPGLYAHPPLSGEGPEARRCLMVELNEYRGVQTACFL